jgi:hypothetical protein
MRGISASLLLWLLPLSALPQSFTPKDLEGWQSWVLQDKPFLRCPFLELTQSGGRFTQGWIIYSEGWIPLPGNNDNWPADVAVNGAPAAVVSRDGTPQFYVGTGAYNVMGHFCGPIVESLWLCRIKPDLLQVNVAA